MDNTTPHYSRSLYMLFPGIAMLLGWGLRGYIGGGPYGAMIPGAMVALAIGILLRLKPAFLSILVVFGVVGVGLGGEMTYGQTLGFLRDPGTLLWGCTGTTVKGAVWGLCGGALIGLGLIHHKLKRSTIIIALILLLIGLMAGIALINDPKLIYFSDPINKPRSESWGGLLAGALALVVYLRFNIQKSLFKLVSRFSIYGLIAGGLGFGLGGLWIFLGSQWPDVMFSSWWKMMEFTFGLLFGAGLGYASWKSGSEIEKPEESEATGIAQPMELLVTMALVALVYYVFPLFINLIIDALAGSPDSFISSLLANFLQIFKSYAFYGSVFIVIALYRSWLVWQIGITLTFSHTAIDYMRDLRPAEGVEVAVWIQVLVAFISTFIVAYLVANHHRKTKEINSMFQILVWSTIAVAFISLFSDIFIEGAFPYKGFPELLLRTLFVHFIFLGSAIYVTLIAKRLVG